MECPICRDSKNLDSNYNCDHKFCKSCIIEWNKISYKCPLCQEDIINIQEIKSKKKLKKYERFWNRISCFTEAGWSCSSFGGISRVREKFKAFVHQEYNKEMYINESHLLKSSKLGTDLFYRDIKKKKVEKEFFPGDLLKLLEQNPKFYFE